MKKSKESEGVWIEVDCCEDGRWVSKTEWMSKAEIASFADELKSEERIHKRRKHKRHLLPKPMTRFKGTKRLPTRSPAGR